MRDVTFSLIQDALHALNGVAHHTGPYQSKPERDLQRTGVLEVRKLSAGRRV